jgi:hypothetical protein
MKKIGILGLSICFFLFGCSGSQIENGYGFIGGNSLEFEGFVALKIEEKNNPTDENVTVTFNYGHDYPEYYDFSKLLGNAIDVFVTDDLDGYTEPDSYVSIYHLAFESSSFVTEDNRCDPGKSIFDSVKYQQEFSLEINFSELVMEKGLLVIRVSETRVIEETTLMGRSCRVKRPNTGHHLFISKSKMT